MKSPHAIEVKNLNVKVGAKILLSEISFKITGGEHLAIVGANGAGKTTLLRSLMGLNAHHGQIQLNGTLSNKLSRRDLAQQIAYVPQQLSDNIPFTVREFILMSRYAHQGAFAPERPEDREATEYIIARTGLESIADRTLSTLSGGERQKTSIAAALAQQCPILILDEPCSHLDPRQQASVQALLTTIGRDQNLTILTVTHDLNWAAQHFDRILGLAEGRLLHDAPPLEFMKPDTLFEIYQTTFQTLPHPQTGKPLILSSS